jgi:hypothetical protein
MGALFSSDAANVVQAFPEAIAGDVDENAAGGNLLLRLIPAYSRMPDVWRQRGTLEGPRWHQPPSVRESRHKPGMYGSRTGSSRQEVRGEPTREGTSWERVMYKDLAASYRFVRPVRKGSRSRLWV